VLEDGGQRLAVGLVGVVEHEHERRVTRVEGGEDAVGDVAGAGGRGCAGRGVRGQRGGQARPERGGPGDVGVERDPCDAWGGPLAGPLADGHRLPGAGRRGDERQRQRDGAIEALRQPRPIDERWRAAVEAAGVRVGDATLAGPAGAWGRRRGTFGHICDSSTSGRRARHPSPMISLLFS
jgi:hypothetical protein